ncbi:MAG: NUDIX hydrolase [Patescibacteria group bacterium]
MKPKILSRKTNYKGIWANVIRVKLRLPNGKTDEWEYISSDDAVAIVAVDDKKNIYLTKEWRPAQGKEILQIPAGMCAAKTTKGVLKQARDESREELGLDAKKWEKLISYFIGGRHNSVVHIFLATDLFESKKESEDSEILDVVKMPFKKAYKKFFSGKSPVMSFTVIGLLLVKEKLKL